MCFRPPTAAKPKKCPKCGTMNPGTLKICRKCQSPLSSPDQESADKPKTPGNNNAGA